MLCYFCMQEKYDQQTCPHCQKTGVPVPEPHQLKPGTVLYDRYIIGRVIGEGGFGITYIGHDNVLDLTVAIKEYYPYGYTHRFNGAGNTVSVLSQSEVFYKGKDRFLQEAKNLAKFRREPGIVEVTDFIEENNTAYIIMEYLEGMNLRAYLKQNGLMTAERAFSMLLPIMGSLEKIHKSGIIHRDISPENIMVMSDGSLKLMDFGAARDYVNDEKSLSVILKHGYAPEEQYRRRGEQGPWTDVYALCATIYRCITGKAPVDSVDRLYADTMKKPSELGVEISPALEQVLLYGLAVRKDDRCPDMATLLKLSRDALAQKPVNISAPQPAAPVRQRDPYATVALNNTVPYNGNASFNAPGIQPAPQQQPKPLYPAYPQPAAPAQTGNKGVRIAVIILICCIAIGVIAGTVQIFGNKSDSNTLTSSSNVKKVRMNDEASLLTSNEKSDLTSQLDKLSEDNEFDIVVLTINSLNGKTDQEYAEEYYDSHNYGYGQNADGVLLLYALNDNRLYICTSGSGTTMLSNYYLDNMLSAIKPYFSRKEYYQGILEFIEMVKTKIA